MGCAVIRLVFTSQLQKLLTLECYDCKFDSLNLRIDANDSGKTGFFHHPVAELI